MRSVVNIIAATSLAVAGTVTAATQQSATVVVSQRHSDALDDITNTTLYVPIGVVYSGASALDAVSTLSLTGATGVPLDSIICTPFVGADGTGTHGFSFNASTPSLVSTNTVRIGSIVCDSNTDSAANSSSSSSSSSYANTSSSLASSSYSSTTTVTSTLSSSSPRSTSSSSSRPIYTSSATNLTYVSTYYTTVKPTYNTSARSTVTAIVVTQPSATSSAASTSTAATTTQTPGLSGINAASSVIAQGAVYHVLAIVGLGVAFAL